jgi:hypothetical protein
MLAERSRRILDWSKTWQTISGPGRNLKDNAHEFLADGWRVDSLAEASSLDKFGGQIMSGQCSAMNPSWKAWVPLNQIEPPSFVANEFQFCSSTPFELCDEAA